MKKYLALGLALTFAGCSDDAPTEAGPAPASVYVVHGINGIDLGATEALPVDISVNGACLIQGFTFGTIAGPVALQSGSYDIAVYAPASAADPCSGATVIEQGVEVTSGISATIVAHLDLEGAPTASVFVNDVTELSSLYARHAARFGPVDVIVNLGDPSEVRFNGLAIGEEAGADGLSAAGYRVIVVPSDGVDPVFDETLSVAAGRYYVAYAVGTPANGTFEVLLQEIDPAAVPTPLQ